MKRTIPFLMLISVLLVLDQITKFMVSRSIPYGTSKNVIPGFFNFSHVRNRGAIFGFFSQSGSSYVYILLTLASLAAFGLVIYYFLKIPASDKLLKVTLSLVLAGAMGNLLDRLLRGFVTDFLDFYIGRFHWPSFNVADSCITVGAILLVYIFFFRKGPKCSLC